MSKSACAILCVLAGFILESLFQVNAYILIVIIVALFAFIWHMEDQKKHIESKREQQELQVMMQSTEKDAHLKLKQLITMVSSIPSPLMLLDEKGNIVLHNDVKVLLLQPIIEEEDLTYLHNPFPYDVQEFIKDSYILEKNFGRIIEIHGIEYQSLSVPVMSRGKFCGCLILFQDISKALEGEKMQKRFLADASHELKTPISIIKGMVEILNREDFHDEDTRRDFLREIEQEINRLDEIVKDILILSKISSGHAILDRHKIDLQALIQESIQSLQKGADKKGLKINFISSCNELIFCDQVKMRQVVTNLLSNAIKYSDEGAINIRLFQQDAKIILEVQDQGRGLSQAQMDKIFDRFYRVDDDRSRINGGSGLGLAIVKSIVEAHGGNVEIDSEVNVGSTFRVSLKN